MMKQFILRNKNTVPLKAASSSFVLSLCFYTVVRVLFYEFPMTWMEEAAFFVKVIITGCFALTAAATLTAWLYIILIKIVRGKNPLGFRVPNTLFLKKNKEHVHYPACAN
jgi:hypothetical protein